MDAAAKAAPAFTKGAARLIKILSMQQLEQIRDRQADKLTVLLFWANWYPECEELRETLEKIASNLQHILIAWVSPVQSSSLTLRAVRRRNGERGRAAL